MLRFSALRTALLAVFIILQPFFLQAQPGEAARDSALVAYPELFALMADTVKENQAIVFLEIHWMDTIFQLERRHAKFIEGIPIPKEDNMMYSGYREEPWDGKGYVVPHANCHSFGLAQSFGAAGIDAMPLFDPFTFVSPESLEVLLCSVYEKQYSLDGTSMRDLKQPIAPGNMLVFRDSSGFALHTAFQSAEGLLSKNGRYEPRVYNRLEYLKRVYYNATTIDVYTLNAEKVKAYLEKLQMQALLED